MASTLEHLKPQLAGLPEAERAELALYLLTTLDDDEPGASEAWSAEIARRVAEIKSGRAVGKPADQVFAELREQYP